MQHRQAQGAGGLAQLLIRKRVLSTAIGKPWKSLGFDFTPTKSMVRYNYANGEWNAGTLQSELAITIHPLSNALHYGQAIFEGLKAFHCADGKVRVFNSKANAMRMQRGCARLYMPPVPIEMFDAALDRLIIDNVDYVPPYGSGGSLYIRPFLFGHGAKLGLGPAPEVCHSPVALHISSHAFAVPRGLPPPPPAGARLPSTHFAFSPRPSAPTTGAASRRSMRSWLRTLTARRPAASAT